MKWTKQKRNDAYKSTVFGGAVNLLVFYSPQIGCPDPFDYKIMIGTQAVGRAKGVLTGQRMAESIYLKKLKTESQVRQ